MKAIALLALFLFGAVFGQQHVDTTAITVADVIEDKGEHFLVSIDRIEDEIDVNGVILAERGIHVALQFDIVDFQQVTVNGVPAYIGYNELKVEAGLYEIDADGQPSPFDKIVSVDVRIFVGVRSVQLDDGSMLQGVYIQERVVGIQEKEVWQATAKEQVLVVKADGSIYKFESVEIDYIQGEVVPDAQVDPMPDQKPHHGHGHGHHGHHGKPMENPETVPGQEGPQESEMTPPKKCNISKYWHKFVSWFHGLPFYLRLLVSFVGGLVLGFVGIAVMKCLCCTFCRSKKCKKEENYKANIHLYSLQYTALPQDEKDAEKKAAESV
jgi:hypothetical protein